MDDEFYNYFPTDTGPTDYGETIVLEPFKVTPGDDDGGSNEDGPNFTEDFQGDGSDAFPLQDGDDTLGGFWDSLVSGFGNAFSNAASGSKAGASSGSSSGGKSSTSTSTNKTATSATYSNTGITPMVLFGFGALILAAVYIGKNSK